MMEGDQGLPTLSHQNKAEKIANTDRYGKTEIDGIYQGVDWFMQFTCLEYRAGSIAAWWPFGTAGLLGVIARLRWSLASPLVLTAIAGTPASAAPATFTATRAILADGFNTQTLFGPTLRKLPIRQILYPFDSGGGVIAAYSST